MEEYSNNKGNIESENPSVKARMHTAEHIFFKALQKQIPEAKLEKIELDEEESSFFVISPELNIDHIIQAEKTTNEIIKENRAVNEYFVKKTDLNAMKELRIRIERIKEETVRVIEVEGFDKSACSGNHVAKTGLIKGILVTRFNALGKNRYELRYKVDYQPELFEFAGLARQVKEVAGTDYPMLVNFIKNMKNENQKLKDKVRDLSANIKIKVKKEQVNDINFHHAVFPGINKKQFIDKINEIEDEKFVACFVNKDEKKTIAIRTNCLDASSILQELFKKFSGRGGGNKLLAQGSIETDPEKVFEKVRKIIS